MGRGIRTVVAVVFSGLAASATAMPLDITDITGAWFNPTPVSGITINNVADQGTDTVRWGTPATAAGQSGYNFTPAGDLLNVTLGSAFLVGTFQHVNQPVFGSLSSIDYSFGFATNGVPAAVSNVFHFIQTDTANAQPCPAGPEGPSISICDDFVNISGATFNQQITVGSDTYFFNLLGFSKDGGATIKTGFQSPEGETNTAGLYGIVTAAPISVPEPLSAALLGLGLAAFAWARRRRS